MFYNIFLNVRRRISVGGITVLAHHMKYNSPLPKQTTGQNRAKLLKMFIYISKIAP